VAIHFYFLKVQAAPKFFFQVSLAGTHPKKISGEFCSIAGKGGETNTHK
jgi:hypothetical protein